MKLYILAFDHRSSFSNLFKNKNEIEKAKQIIFSAFLKVFNEYKHKENLAILIDEEYGEKVIKKAKQNNIKIYLPIEKSGKNILELEYKDLNEIKKINPDYIKILIRYNPLNIEINKKQISVLKKINDFCLKNNFKILLELLVPPEKEDLLLTKNYDEDLRFQKTKQAIIEIKDHIKVDLWKLEGFKKNEWKEITKLINSKIVFLGRGAEKEKVKEWLIESKNIKNIIGFAIGRTIFLEPIKEYSKKLLNKEKTIQKIAENFKYFIDLADK